MISIQHGDLTRLVFDTFEGLMGSHGVYTRQGGVSQGAYASLNMGHTVGDDPVSVQENQRRVYEDLGIGPEAVVSGRQVHGDRVAVVHAGDGGRVYPETDALLCDVPGLYLLLRFADCVPLFFYAPERRAVGLAHAGWQGTLSNIAGQTAQAFMAAFGCRPEDLRVGIGPAIGPCCFQVGPEIVERVRADYGAVSGLLTKALPDGHANLDLWGLNVLQLQDVGLTRIEVASLCTSCQVESFYSHRREKGRTGRFPGVIGLAQPTAG